jgi:hypothetical protein
MRRFLAIWAISLALFSAAVLALTIGVDPYRVIGTPPIKGLTADKVAAADRPRLTKPLMVERGTWHTLVFGASNADVGIDPTSDAWPEADRPVFNIAIDGSEPYTQLRFLQHALVTQHPKLIMLGVSLEDAMRRPNPVPGQAKAAPKVSAAVAAEYGFENRMRVLPDGSPNPGYALERLKDTVFATFSLQALGDSVLTVFRQNDPERTHETAQGQNSAGNFAKWLRTEGSYVLVLDKDNERTPKLLAWAAQGGLTTTAPLGDMVRLGHAHGAEVIVFIMPSYVDQLEVLRQTGLTPLFDRWKMDVAQTLEAADPMAPPTPLWDFSGISPYTTELLPAPGDLKHPLQWFWEPIHFRTALGDVMVRRMLGNSGTPASDNQWGDLITTQNLPVRAETEAAKQRAWATAHPADVARLSAVIATAAKAVCGGPVTQCPKPGVTTAASR